jgi:hypothetical protein
MPVKIAIVGSRKYAPMKDVRNFVKALKKNDEEYVIVSGGAHGVDRVAEEEAREQGIPVEIYIPNWQAHGKAAGPMRNKKIVDAADAVYAFWDGESRGTKSSIDLAEGAGKPCYITYGSEDDE